MNDVMVTAVNATVPSLPPKPLNKLLDTNSSTPAKNDAANTKYTDEAIDKLVMPINAPQ